MRRVWNWLTDRLGRKRAILLVYLLGVGIVALLMNLLMVEGLYHSSLLYVLIPYLISVAITFFRGATEAKSRLGRYISHLATAITVLFSTSILIGEGFICILFFAPIYLIVVSFSYAMMALTSNNKKYSLALPAIILALSMEGVTPGLSLPRHTFAEVTVTTSLTPQEIKQNLAREFTLERDRYWLLSIFPMPYRIEAGSLNKGDVHRVYTRYHRWFVTNTHEGQAELLIEEVKENYVKTRVLSDTTYFSTYLNGTGTEITLTPNDVGGTDVNLKLHYRRNLDPAWYFYPLQKFGVTKMGELILQQLVVREDPQ